MDALSGLASVVAVAQLATSVGGALKTYFSGVRHAQEEIKLLFHSLNNLRSFLEQLQKLAHANPTILAILDASVQKPTGPLALLQVELGKLDTDLETGKVKGKFGLLAQKLTWPFKKDDVNTKIYSIEKQKSALDLELGLGILYLQVHQVDILESIRQDVLRSQSNQEHRNITSWLSGSLPDISSHHNSARSKHEETTGMWLTQGEELKLWMTTKNSFIWLNGGAGAGKSILCSTIIDCLQKNTYKDTFSPVVYWYFSFADNATLDVSNFLCSIVRDLCSNSFTISDTVRQAYSRFNNGQQRPTIDSLHEMLATMFENFNQVYLVIDALDEYPIFERNKLLKALATIRKSDPGNLHLLATSRREKDIEDSFMLQCNQLPGVFWDIRMQGSHVEHDIKTYVNHRLENEPKFQKWTEEERERVKSRLAERADGMFRLVALQLDALSESRSKKERRKALEELPSTLDNFYDRILKGISESDVAKVQRAFYWLTFSLRPMTLRELAEAILIDHETLPYFDLEDRYDDEKDILDILPAGLVKLTKLDVKSEDELEEFDYNLDKHFGNPNSPKIIQFAHFSVQEYLSSSRGHTHYRVPKAGYGHSILSSVCAAYLLFVGENLEVSQRDSMIENFKGNFFQIYRQQWSQSFRAKNARLLENDFPMLNYISIHWLQHTKNAGEVHSLSMDDLFVDLFSSSKHGLLTYTALKETYMVSSQNRFYDFKAYLSHYRGRGADGFGSICKTACLLAYYGLNRQITLLVNRGLIPTPEINEILVSDAVFGDQIETVKLLVKAGFSINSDNKWSPLVTAIWDPSSSLHEMLEVLLDAGADVNAFKDQYRGPPISLAANRFPSSKLETVKLLLKYGADLTIRNKGSYYRSFLEAAIRYQTVENIEQFIQLLDNNAFAGMLYGAIEITLKGNLLEPWTEPPRYQTLVVLLKAAKDRKLELHCGLHLEVLRERKRDVEKEMQEAGIIIRDEYDVVEYNRPSSYYRYIEAKDLKYTAMLYDLDKAIQIIEEFRGKDSVSLQGP